ncbi:MAG TPA: hypothetical protein VH591_02425 [Ktedonobacterales bacterium]|jgi:hypothetical protein
MPSWIELAAAAAVLLLILLIVLIILTLRAANRRRARRQAGMFGIAETHDVFIADKTRITHRPAPLSDPTPQTPESPHEPMQ